VLRGIPQPLHKFFPVFRPIGRWPILQGLRLRIGVNVAELPAKPNIQLGVATGEMGFRIAAETILRPALYSFRDLDAPRVRIEYPSLAEGSAATASARIHPGRGCCLRNCVRLLLTFAPRSAGDE
jgi:hypothetical protein